jgi:hypothetical protein
VYGAVVVSPRGPTLLTASAASPLVAQLLRQTVEAVASPASGGQAPGGLVLRPRVVDVVPADPDDPRGAALAAAVLPLVLAGAATGVLISLLGRPGVGQVVALVSASVLAGLAPRTYSRSRPA